MDTVVNLVAPIPVGHRVRLTYYVHERPGLFSSTSVELPHEPVVEDLDSGVIYCSDRPYSGSGVKRPRVPYEVDLTATGVVAQTVEGVVRACRVLTVRSFSEVDVQTHLTIAEQRA